MAMTGTDDRLPVLNRAAARLRLGAGLFALVLAAVALVPIEPQSASCEPDAYCDPPPPPPWEGLEKVLERVENGKAEAEAKAVAGEDGLVSAGTPCFMRHKRMALGVDRNFRHRFAAATLATTPARKEVMLEALAATAPSGLPAWRVALARTELALRDGRNEDARTHLRSAAMVEVPSSCRADELFLRAVATPAAAASAELLDAAVAADPGFWAAQERLALLVAGGTGRDVAACGRDAARAIRSTIQLGALATADTQFQRLERALLGLEPNGRTQLLRGMILRQTGRAEKARSLWKAALAALGPGDCDATLRIALKRMIDNTPEAEP